ncbi:MAG: sodium/calcium exchanger protein [Pseudomonadales bacterium]|nr:sodium/calcium exchanger protein [Pseudomonadales bacterium]
MGDIPHSKSNQVSESVPLSTADASAHAVLEEAGFDTDRLAVPSLGTALKGLQSDQIAPEFKRAGVAAIIWLLLQLFKVSGISLNPWVSALIDLSIGLIIIQVACQSIIAGTERLAARFNWDHYVAATWSEILSTLPEIVVVAFLVSVNPYLAFVTVMLTVYNNALVFSCYSYFLPKDYRGKYLMPKPITEAGTQILVAGGALGLIMGFVIVGVRVTKEQVEGFNNNDLIFIACLLLLLFFIYLYRLTVYYANEEESIKAVLGKRSLKFRLDLIELYRAVKRRSWAMIIALFAIGIVGSLIGGACVNDFAEIMTQELKVGAFLTAFLLAAFGGMSEYVILWNAHRKKDYGIALANAFGGMTQVLFLILPFTLIFGSIAGVSTVTENHNTWLGFSTTSILLFSFLFPTFYTLTALLEEDHTFDLLDTAVLVSIVLILIYLLMTYGNGVH